MHFRTPVMFDADDTSLPGGEPSPEEQEFGSAKEFAAARQALVHSAPEILPTEEAAPAPAEGAVDPIEAEVLRELTGTPPAPEAPAEGATGGTPEPTIDPYAEFGGIESVRHALALRQTFGDPDGQRALAGQLLSQLGYQPEQIRAALEGNAPEAAPDPLDAIASMEDGDVVTGAELKAIVAALINRDETVTRQAVQPIASQWDAQQAAQIQQVADATYLEVLGSPPQDPEGQQRFMSEAQALQQRAELLVTPGEKNPSQIRIAILRANEQLTHEAEDRFRQLVAKKRAAAAALPTNLGGGQPPGGEPVSEPKNMAEARKMAREFLPR